MADDRLWIGAKERTPAQFDALRDAATALATAAPSALSDVRAFCLFIGYPRSGHSLVGSLIDAHPHAAMAHELDALDFLDHGFSRAQLFHVILENARRFSERGREWTGYDYSVPGQWQGRHEGVHVVGDKKGGRSIRRLHDEPGLIDELRELVRVPLRFVHVVRNPWDNIATRKRRKPQRDIETLADRHFALVRRVVKLKQRVGSESVLDVRHEDLITDAATTLRRVCTFLGLAAPDEYVSAAAEIVYPSPRKSRNETQWPDGLIQRIAERAADVPFLADYSFDD